MNYENLASFRIIQSTIFTILVCFEQPSTLSSKNALLYHVINLRYEKVKIKFYCEAHYWLRK